MATDPSLEVPGKEFKSVTPSDVSFTDEKEKPSRESEEDDNANHEQLQQELERVESSMYPTSLKLVSIMLAVVLSIFLVALDMVSTSPTFRLVHAPLTLVQTIVATAIPRITDEFKSLDDVGWYGSAFFLTVASFQSTWGKVRPPTGHRLLHFSC
jgi:hypothetical protein